MLCLPVRYAADGMMTKAIRLLWVNAESLDQEERLKPFGDMTFFSVRTACRTEHLWREKQLPIVLDDKSMVSESETKICYIGEAVASTARIKSVVYSRILKTLHACFSRRRTFLFVSCELCPPSTYRLSILAAE